MPHIAGLWHGMIGMRYVLCPALQELHSVYYEPLAQVRSVRGADPGRAARQEDAVHDGTGAGGWGAAAALGGAAPKIWLALLVCRKTITRCPTFCLPSIFRLVAAAQQVHPAILGLDHYHWKHVAPGSENT